MPGRLPTTSDLPHGHTITIVPSPTTPAEEPQNERIMLHGLGDTHAPFADLARKLPLPETVQASMSGVIAIGGPFPLSAAAPLSEKAKTPVLLLGGTPPSLITEAALAQKKNSFALVEYVRWSKRGDGMPGSREEMLPIMQFFARRLRSREGVPKDSLEIN
ncbi:MAG: hypothetical protein M1826_007320 [Phylliscum demangeonii]|nr:MAG: hypothetical protein M1826_007320 [Phylliscum demangeonii]